VQAPSLPELQALFWDAIASAPGEARLSPRLCHWIRPGETLDPAQRVGIYADMYWTRLRDVLRGDFARTAEMLGEERFDEIARGYLAERPSRDPSIARAGEAFADHLAAYLPADAPPFVPDLARLEWARVEAFTAADAVPLRLEDLQQLSADELPEIELRAVPSSTLLELGWPVQRLLAESAPCTIAPAPTLLRVWRRDFLVFHASVDAVERPALLQLVRGATFEEIAATCAEPADAAALLARWLEDGLIANGAA
jgi:hypothetical protein